MDRNKACGSLIDEKKEKWWSSLGFRKENWVWVLATFKKDNHRWCKTTLSLSFSPIFPHKLNRKTLCPNRQ